jgi:hypothetical protein
MATTKTPTKKSKAKRAKTPSTAKAKATSNGSKASSSRTKASSRSKASSSRPKASSSRSKNGSPAAQRSSGSGSHGVVDELKAARDTVEDTGKKAATATGKAVSKAKVPLIASGAALAGVAGGLALNSTRSKGSKVLGMRMPKTKVKIRSKDLVKAADRVAGAGEQIGRVSTGFRELQGTSEANGNGHHRSPIEVLIQGLTRRH